MEFDKNNDRLIITGLSEVKGHCDLSKHLYGHNVFGHIHEQKGKLWVYLTFDQILNG